jgi:hypothetical protein
MVQRQKGLDLFKPGFPAGITPTTATLIQPGSRVAHGQKKTEIFFRCVLRGLRGLKSFSSRVMGWR